MGRKLARPQSEGINYFSLDVDMNSDDRIAYIESKYGFIAFGLIVRLLMRIYRDGYYMVWDEREQFLFSRRVNVDIESTLNIVNECINEGIFNKELYEQYGILTSHGIQCRYLKACERRKNIVIASEYNLITSEDSVKLDNVTFKSINADNNEVNANIELTKTPQIKVKVNKSKNISTTTTTTAREEEIDRQEKGDIAVDDDLAEVYQVFQDNIQPIAGQIMADQIQDMLTTYGKLWLIEAIKRAVKRGARNIGYIEGILKKWKAGGGIDDGEGGKNDGKQQHPRENKKSDEPIWDNFYANAKET